MTEICREVNGIDKCHRSDYKNYKSGSKILTACVNCKVSYAKIYSTLKRIKGLNMVKMRFWDKKPPADKPPYGTKTFEIYTFCFFDYEAFRSRILTQTLIPHLEVETNVSS